ncbi:hypothetical protein CEE44_03600 [Candidatus Woesearchaeota archaeon B3_Woes]|nr:MAG: hypothetical protein CEE44_03600 [Candidatus Woesearchaeota archaeon B3_Woes]
MKKEVSQLAALFCIELILFLPFYVADVYADKPVLSNIQASTTHNSLNVTWQTDVLSNSIVDYGRDSYIELTKQSQQTTTNHSIIISPLRTNQDYYYRIESCTGDGCDASTVTKIKTQPAPAPEKIQDITSKDITPRSIEITWQQSLSPYFQSYLIYRNGEFVTNISSKTQVTYLDTGLDGSTRYMYEVSAINKDFVEGELSDKLYGTTLTPDTTPPTIQNVSISSISLDSVTIEFITNEDANSTIVYGIASFDQIKSSQDHTQTHSVTLTNLQNDTTYQYKIIACDLDGNCAEKSDNDAFTPTEIIELNIELNVPTISNKAVIPVSGTVTPHTKVRFFANNIYKGLIGMVRNQDGEIQFDVPGFSSGNNTLKVIIEDSIGNTKEQTYNIYVDLAPPILDIPDLPIQTSNPTLIIEGSSSELVDIDIYISLSQAKDTTPPGKISNLHVDEAKENSILLAWTDVEDEDFNEYIIYRDDIPIGTTVTSPYLDDYLVSSGKTYSYSIVAVDTSCNIGQKVYINQKTIEGGLVYDEDVEPENIECMTGEQSPAYSLQQQYPGFREEITLRQGINEIVIEAIDRAGNSIQKIHRIYHDSEPPEILDTNIDSITPSYVRDITITGTVSEETYVCIYVNSEIDVKTYREEEVDESAEDIFGESKYCASTENGTFSIDIELRRDPDYAYDIESPTYQTRSMLIRTGTAWRNNIKIVATDKVGLRNDPGQGDEILYSLCGGGGDWGIIVDDVMPAEITPRHLLEGMAQISFSVDLIWRGSGPKPAIADIDIREGYPMDMSADLEKTFDDWVSQIYDDAWSDEFDKGYVLIDLKAQDPDPSDEMTTYEKEKNLSQHNQGQCFNVPFTDTSYLEKAGCVRIPLTFMIDYEQKRKVRIRDEFRERQETHTQKECMDVEVLIQPRIPPDMIPNAFLESSVDFLNATIEGIDAVLGPVETALKLTTLGCFGMWAGFYVKKASEGFACLGDVNVKDCQCTIKEGGLTCTDDVDKGGEGKCNTCLTSKISTKTFEQYMHWTCDRVLCPAVPSYETYIKQNKDNPNSNCEGVPQADYKKDLPGEDKRCKNAPKGLVGKDGKPIQSDSLCCDNEYMQEWDAGAIMMNELKESERLVNSTKDTSFSEAWRGISDFKLCKPGENEQRQINFGNDGWYILEPNPKYDSKKDVDQQTDFKTLVWEGIPKQERRVSLTDSRVLSDNLSLTKGISLTDVQNTNSIIRFERCNKYNVDESYKYKQAYWPSFETEVSLESLTSFVPVQTLEGFEKENLPQNYKISGTSKTITSNGEEIKVQKIQDSSGQKHWYKEDTFNYIEPSTIKEEDRIPIKTPRTSTKSKKIFVPEQIVREACSGFSDEYIINPPDSIFRSVQSVCLSGTYSYLKMYKKILGLINNCFQTILITGDGSSGVCQATLSYYVCDFVYGLFSCFKGYSGFGTERGSGNLGFFKGIVGSGAEVQQTIQNRYGDTNLFNVMFVDKKILHSACMGFFGADTDIDIMSMAEQAIEMPVKSTVALMPANRRFVGYNPIDGITNHVYHLGLMIVSGSDDMRYEVDLVCSTDNSCDSRYFENGRCDCAYSGEEITKDVTNAFGGNGRLDQSEILNEEAYVSVSYDMYDSKVRYDKARVTYDYLNNKGQIQQETVERELSQIGGEPFAHCSFDILTGTYRCSVFEEPTTACIKDSPDLKVNSRIIKEGEELQYDADKELKFSFEAKKESKSGREDSRNFFAVLEIKDGDNVIFTAEQIIDDTTSKTYTFRQIEIKDSWFSGESSYNCFIEPKDVQSIGIDVLDCDTDGRISCREDNGQYIFTIEEGTYEGSFAQSNPPVSYDCIFSQEGKQNCESFYLEVKNLANIKCNNPIHVDRRISTSTTSTATLKELYYTLTIYRPQTENERAKSKTVAKCDGVKQIEEGSFKINNTKIGAQDE